MRRHEPRAYRPAGSLNVEYDDLDDGLHHHDDRLDDDRNDRLDVLNDRLDVLHDRLDVLDVLDGRLDDLDDGRLDDLDDGRLDDLDGRLDDLDDRLQPFERGSRGSHHDLLVNYHAGLVHKQD